MGRLERSVVLQKLAAECDGTRLRYPHDLLPGDSVPTAVRVLRESLASARDGTVVIVQVGFSTNLARLLGSPPDAVSKLAGIDLVKRKVRLLSLMGGGFQPVDDQPFREYNILGDIASAQQIVDNWPTPVVFSGIEIGNTIEFPGASIVRDFGYVPHHPLAEAYLLHSPPTHNRPTWDLTSVLYAVRPESGYFSLSPSGRVRVTGDGQTIFKPSTDGRHQFLKVDDEQRRKVKAALIELATQQPDK